MAAVALLTVPGRRDPSLSLCSLSRVLPGSLREFFLDLWGARVRACYNVWPVKPFETVTVIKSHTDNIHLTWQMREYITDWKLTELGK